MSILSYFPYPEFRRHQKEVLLELEDNWDSFSYFMIEAPTGFGKSAVAYSLAKWVQGERGGYSHFLVSDKFLQEQYLRDFKDIVLVKGRSNFLCKYNPLGELTCDRGFCTLVKGFSCPHKPHKEMVEDMDGRQYPMTDDHGDIYDWGSVDEQGLSRCSYWDQKDGAIRSDLTIHNYAYYLHEQNFAHSFSKRELGVFDEAHITENILMGFVSKDILAGSLNRIWRERYPDERYHFTIPQYDTTEKWVLWITNTLNALLSLNAYYTDIINNTDPKSFRVGEVSTKFNRYVGMIERLKLTKQYLEQDPDNWVWFREQDRVSFKPVTIKQFSSLLFNFTNKQLLMSATILDHEKLKRYLGIKEDVKFIRVSESTIPVDNRPIYQDHVGKATRKTMDVYLPKMLNRIDSYIIPKKGNNKGVIHTHTHKIAQYIMDNSKYNGIMTSNTGNENKRHEVFQEFFDSKPPRVMVSPSMNLGVDLYDDRCRWQVICKIPYPSLGDPQVRKRMDIDPDWYDWNTLMALIQTYGRGCRSETDWCDTYVTDSMFAWLVSKNRHIIPRWFMEAIRRER